MARVIYKPTQWAWVDEANPAVTHQDPTLFYLRSENVANKRIYTQYDLTDTATITNNAIAPTSTATVIRADVHLYCDQTSGPTTAETADGPRECTSGWDSSTITWATQPARSTTRDAVERYIAQKSHALTLDCRDIVQEWLDVTLTNNGLWMGVTTEDAAAPYQWRFAEIYARPRGPELNIEYRIADSLPATATDTRKHFVGEALTDLSRTTIKRADYTLTLDLEDGSLDITGDLIAFSRIIRKLPFLMGDKFDLGGATFQLNNEDGEYSPFNKSSKLYARRAVGRDVTLKLDVAGQEVTLFQGEIEEVRNYTDRGVVEIAAKPQPIQRQFKETLDQDELSGDLTIYNANPSDATYELMHNQLGTADTKLNLASFITAKAKWITQNFTVGTLWASKPAEDMIGYVLEAGLGSLYWDWEGRYSLHAWQPTEPTATLLEDYDSCVWYEDFGNIINQVRVEYGEDERSFVWYADSDSQARWGVHELTIQNPLIRTESRAAQVAVFYAQAMADPVGKGRVTGGMNLLRFDLGDAVRLQESRESIDEICIVTAIGFDPLECTVELELVKANWPMPRRDFVNVLTWGALGEQDYPGTATSPMQPPVPSDFTFYKKDDGSVASVIGWTQPVGAIQPDGFIVYVKHGTTAGQPVPASSDYDQAEALTHPDLNLYGFAIPQDDYATFAVQGWRDKTPEELAQVGIQQREFTDIISSSSAPDWWDRQYSTSVHIKKGKIYGDTTGSTGILLDGDNLQLSDNVQVENQTVLNMITVANRRARQTGYTSALVYEQHTSLDNTASIYVRGHNLTIGESTIAYSSAWLRPYLFNTTYYIYTDDSGWAGGGVTYTPTTVWDVILQGKYRYYVGEIKTPDSGTYFTSGEAGGAGGQEE